MNKSEYKYLAQLIFDCFNHRDFSAVEPYVDENIVFNFPGVGDINGDRRSLLFMKTLLRKYSELNFEVSEIIVENNKAVAIWANTGKNADGKEYSNSGMTLFHFKNGKIIFLSDYFKDTSFVDK